MLRHVCATIDVPVVLDVDLAGVGVGDGGEGLLREVDGAPAPRGAEVDDLYGDAPAGARVRHALVRRAGAPDHVPVAARRAAVPEDLARRRDHRPLRRVPEARRRCIIYIGV